MFTKTVFVLLLMMLYDAVSESMEDDALEHNYKVSLNNNYKDQRSKFNYFKLNSDEPSTSEDEEQLLQTVEVEVPDYSPDIQGDTAKIHPAEEEGGSQVFFRARDGQKTREFLQCNNEDVIVYFCYKSCHNVFKTICFGEVCPPRLVAETSTVCREQCKKTYKRLRGQKYEPPEKY